ncbi:hypothetical protein D9619_002363 [Psilocybe cf. subviscida]|uniref:Uncharacterized protein n=1 Tax=Psilocybe cf. subviscida TaxID=2480587 RepID=A0A8H5EUZ1_9AGAR|nr:hypothetical protein D9619_002363 [Psilocybe cf. subviscida]
MFSGVSQITIYGGIFVNVSSTTGTTTITSNGSATPEQHESTSGDQHVTDNMVESRSSKRLVASTHYIIAVRVKI